MEQHIRNKYQFTGPRAGDSVKYYDNVVSHRNDVSTLNTDYLAWDAAHKFGTRVTAPDMASFRNGIVIGQNALAAAEFLDNEYRIAYNSCEIPGRSRKMKELMEIVYAVAEEKYDVIVQLM